MVQDTNMTQGKPLRLLLFFALPLMFGNIFQQLYTVVDIAIIGHTDNTGSDAINNPLSENRAKSVSTYLKNSGVNASQIKTVEGQGSKNPVADNSTAEGRTQNRRVEVYIYASQEMIKAAEAQAK